jgi:hypothetical protein
MPAYPQPAPAGNFKTVLRSFAQAPGLPFQDVLTAEHIEAVAAEEGVDFGSSPGCVWSVAVTLWAFLAQVLSKEKACVAAVARVMVLRVALGRQPCAAETGAYCKARAKLTERFVQRLTLDLGRQLERDAPAAWRWKGRRVFLADGTTVSMPDTPANQQAYPQPQTQKPGLGFPLARLVVLLGLPTAALRGAASGPYVGKGQGEPALLRSLLDQLEAGDVLLADCYFGSYWMVALASRRGLDVVFRMHHLRGVDFRRGLHLGADDHIVVDRLQPGGLPRPRRGGRHRHPRVGEKLKERHGPSPPHRAGWRCRCWRPRVLRAINWLRGRFGQPSLVLDRQPPQPLGHPRNGVR